MKHYFLALLICALGTVGCTNMQQPGGYLFVTFRGEATPMTEQIYFMLSEDGQVWEALNEADPVLISDLGEKGVRDPYIIRSPDNKKFYCIATDLSIHLTRHDWTRAQTAGSQSIVVWESKDLVNWSEPRLVKVAPDNAGCTWAPEIVYDSERNEYMVFWASKTEDDNYSKHRIWAARTTDFKTFDAPFIYIEKPKTVIDTTIINEEGTYYRFTKDEQDKNITMETSEHLMTGWKDIPNFSLGDLQGYEGPTCFQIEPKKWMLLLDHYSTGDGYEAHITTDLSSGQFTAVEKMSFPFHPVRHGTVLTITKKEFERLKKADEKGDLKAEE